MLEVRTLANLSHLLIELTKDQYFAKKSVNLLIINKISDKKLG